MEKIRQLLGRIQTGAANLVLLLQPLLNLLIGLGRTRVLLAYLGTIVAVVASSSIRFNLKECSFQLETGSISLMTLLLVIIVTVPILLYFNVNKEEMAKNRDANSDVFERVYIPNCRKIFDLLDAAHYADWSYCLAVNGSTLISREQYKRLCELSDFCKNRSFHKGYEFLDRLTENIGCVVSDIVNVLDLHLVSWSEDEYTFERFYKRYCPNPNYKADLAAYEEEVLLISDLMLELTRICNLLFAKVRERCPDFLSETGVLYIREIKDRNRKESRIEYEVSEISETPYPGLIEFIASRGMRRHYFSKTAEIDKIFPDGIFWIEQ